MRVLYRSVARLFTGLYQIRRFDWAMVGWLALTAWYQYGVRSSVKGALWAGGAALLLAGLALVGRACHHVLFVAEATVGAPAVKLPALMQGVAAGTFYTRDRCFEGSHLEVAVRWATGPKPPRLTAMLPSFVMSGPDGALSPDAISPWTPGVSVTPGRLYMGGGEWPALRLRYLGRLLYLGLEKPEWVGALAAHMKKPVL